MREFRLHGSVRGALRDGRPYREHTPKSLRKLSTATARLLPSGERRAMKQPSGSGRVRRFALLLESVRESVVRPPLTRRAGAPDAAGDRPP